MPEQMTIDFSAPAFTREQAALYGLIRRGRENARSVSFLAGQTGMTTVKVRQVVKELVEDHRIIIVSAVSRPPGYYFPVTAAEFRQGAAQLASRIRSLGRRLYALDKPAAEQIFGQGRML